MNRRTVSVKLIAITLLCGVIAPRIIHAKACKVSQRNACVKGRADAQHDRPARSYYRQSKQDEYDACRKNMREKMRKEGRKPQKRGKRHYRSANTVKPTSSELESANRRAALERQLYEN